MKTETIDPKTLPYHDILRCIKEQVDIEHREKGKYTFGGPCVDASRLASIFIPELEQTAGIYRPLCIGHAFNYDRQRDIYVDITLDQFEGPILKRWHDTKRYKQCITRKKQNLSLADAMFCERYPRMYPAVNNIVFMIGSFKADDYDNPEDMSKYESIEDIPYVRIPKITAMNRKNTLLKEYTTLKKRVNEKKLNLLSMIKNIEKNIEKKAGTKKALEMIL